MITKPQKEYYCLNIDDDEEEYCYVLVHCYDTEQEALAAAHKEITKEGKNLDYRIRKVDLKEAAEIEGYYIDEHDYIENAKFYNKVANFAMTNGDKELAREFFQEEIDYLDKEKEAMQDFIKEVIDE